MEIEKPKKSEILSLLRDHKPKAAPKVQSKETSYKNLSEQFQMKDLGNIYAQQYCKTYSIRYSSIKEYFESYFREEHIEYCDKILNIQPEITQVVVATLYKEMKLKPNVLQSQEKRDNYMQNTDLIFMEDMTGKMQLAFDNTVLKSSFQNDVSIDVENLSTGIVVALKGIQKKKEVNVFQVTEMFCCNLAFQEKILKLPPPIPTSIEKNGNYKKILDYVKQPQDAKFILICSGLDIGTSSEQSQIKSLRYHLSGNSNLQSVMNQVSRVIIAGNLIKKNSELDYNLAGAYSMQDQFRGVYTEITQKMKEVDKEINYLSSGVSIDIMAGDQDPSSTFLPQQPLSHCYFMSSKRNQSLQLVYNPYMFKQNDITILGTSGQNLSDSMKYCKYGNSPINTLESHIIWRHIAPTSPDTLQCFPFEDRDPFVLDELPHIYFVGNCEKFETKLLYQNKKRCRLICVPQLSNSNSFVLVNLVNLDTFEVSL